ncbi:MAG: response regulator [Deltaproteobacteria bacterium]|nr:response regulator [Deltaproteobacteria bacterium]
MTETTRTTSGTANRGSILVVDDTVENLRVLAAMLTEQGYEARPLTNGRQALKAVEHDPPDLVLLDIQMPEMDGYEVCRRLKEQETSRDIPVIFLTALTDTEDKVRAFAAGGVDFVTKPFRVEEILARVAAHVALRRATARLNESYEKLRDLEKLRDNLVHMMVHDMRSPLLLINSGIEDLRRQAADLPGDAVEDLRIASKAARSLVRMTDDLLDLSRLEAQKMPIRPARCDLVEMMGVAAAELGALEPEREILVESREPVVASCDRALIARVLDNLVSNGLKHTPASSRLRLRATAAGRRVRAEVQDEGGGVPPEARTRIFEKFEMTQARKDSGYHSAGVGLAFCKLAVEAHGGTIGVDCPSSGGSIFWFELPVSDD